jgi:hypothetical protein
MASGSGTFIKFLAFFSASFSGKRESAQIISPSIEHKK